MHYEMHALENYVEMKPTGVTNLAAVGIVLEFFLFLPSWSGLVIQDKYRFSTLFIMKFMQISHLKAHPTHQTSQV